MPLSKRKKRKKRKTALLPTLQSTGILPLTHFRQRNPPKTPKFGHFLCKPHLGIFYRFPATRFPATRFRGAVGVFEVHRGEYP